MLKARKEENLIGQNPDDRKLLESAAKNPERAFDALLDMTEEKLRGMISPAFDGREEERLVGRGRSILQGDVSGQLVMDRKLGEFLLGEADERGTGIDLIYSPPSGGLDDFSVLKSSKGYFSSDGAETAFCAVQASCEGVPAVIGVDCAHSDVAAKRASLTYEFHDGSTLDVEQPHRAVVFSGPGGGRVAESEVVSVGGADGTVFRGGLRSAYPTNAQPVYRLLAECYLEALERFGPAEAEKRLSETDVFAEHGGWLLDAVRSEEFEGFQALVRAAIEAADLKVLSTAHTPEAVALTRMYASEVSATEEGGLRVVAGDADYGVGLLRDERMWGQHDDVDLLRLVFLGPETVGAGYRGYAEAYRDTLTEMLYRVMRVGTGGAAVVRLLCMPYKMIFSEGFDSERFAARYGLDHEAVRERAEQLGGENEAYHGCRGVRVTVQREDICELWCESVIRAAKRARDEGTPVVLQILLSMVTFPQEVESFVRVFERKLDEVVGRDRGFVRGISVMIETSGSFHLLEEILGVRGDHVGVNGALFGGNDFTAACLNMNRADSSDSMLPAYVRLGILPDSPYKAINEQIVGKAVTFALRRARVLERKNRRDYLIGLGGEIAGDWESVRWLTENAAPYGLDYVSTPPDRLLFSLFSSARASLRSLYGEAEEVPA